MQFLQSINFNDIKGVLIIFGGAAAIAAAIGKWFGEIAAKRMVHRWERKNQREIEKLRAQLARDQAVLTSTLQSISSGSHLAQERRLQAIEVMWKTMNEVSSFASPAYLVYKIPNKDALFTVPMIRENAAILKEDDRLKKIDSALKQIEPHRPFLGRELYVIFLAYVFAEGAIVQSVIKALERESFEGCNLDNWVEGVKPMFLKNGMGEYITEELDKPGEGLGVLRGIAEQLIDTVVSGKKHAFEGYALAQELRRKIDEIDHPSAIVKNSKARA